MMTAIRHAWETFRKLLIPLFVCAAKIDILFRDEEHFSNDDHFSLSTTSYSHCALIFEWLLLVSRVLLLLKHSREFRGFCLNLPRSKITL